MFLLLSNSDGLGGPKSLYPSEFILAIPSPACQQADRPNSTVLFGNCPKRKKAPEGGLAAALRGERVRNFLLFDLDADGNTNVALLIVALDHNAYIRPVAVLLHAGIMIFVNIIRNPIQHIAQ